MKAPEEMVEEGEVWGTAKAPSPTPPIPNPPTPPLL